MYKFYVMVASISISAIGAATFLASSPERAQKAAIEEQQLSLKAQQPSTSQKAEPQVKHASVSGVERVKRAPNGHFEADFILNNTRVHALIDTGASTIAINETTARRAGVRLRSKDFIYQVNTANGTVKAARAILKTVKIGSIRMRDVEALVLEDRALNTTLIGMSFMNRLRSFEYKSGDLVLRR